MLFTMTFNPDEIIDLISGYPFDQFDGKSIFYEEDAHNMGQFLKNTKHFYDFNLFWGASKCVIIPDNEDYVIKIPFTGSYFETDEADYNIYENFTEAEEDEGWDYCLVESKRFDFSKEFGLDDFFAPTIFIGFTNDIHHFPIYIQPKCEALSYSTDKTSQEDREKTRSIVGYQSEIPISWLTEVRLMYGEDWLIDLVDFLKENGWNDLRSDNLGFYHNKPVIFDYSNFEN